MFLYVDFQFSQYHFVDKTIGLGTLVKDQSSIYVCVYFWALYFIPLIIRSVLYANSILF